MVLSLTFHEYAHAAMARVLGDDTAERQGRLTLNPAVHIDPLGTLILPIFFITLSSAAGGAPFFGWAKPVPFNPNRFSRKVSLRFGTMLVALAGPVSNIVLAFLFTLVIALMRRLGLSEESQAALMQLAFSMIAVNVGLALFNMIPLPPLDGSKVLYGLLPRHLGNRYEELSSQYGQWALLALVIFGGGFLATPMMWVFQFLLRAATALGGAIL